MSLVSPQKKGGQLKPQRPGYDFKQNWKFALLAACVFVLFLLKIIFRFNVSSFSLINIYSAGLLFISCFLFLYYLAYRWAFPSLQRIKIHAIILRIVSSLMIGLGIAVWFYAETVYPKLSHHADWFISLGLQEVQTQLDQIPFPLFKVTFVTLFVFLLMFGVLAIVEKWWGQKKALFTKKVLTISYVFLLVSITTCIFSTDFFQNLVGRESNIYWGGTEDYVNFRIRNDKLTFAEDISRYGGFLYGFNGEGEFGVYLSSTGFYGSLIKFGQDITNFYPGDVLLGTRVLFSFLTASILTAFSLLLKHKLGVIPSVVFSFFCMITYWLLGPSSHLIWFFPVLFFPMLISVFLYPRVLTGKMSFNQFLIICGLGYVLVFLRSYVYLPVMILSGAVPVFYYEVKERASFGHLLWKAVRVCLTGVAGFLLVIGIHYLQLWAYLSSPTEAYSYLVNKAILRSSAGDTNLTAPIDIFHRWMKVPVFYLPEFIYEIFPKLRQSFDSINRFGNLHMIAFVAVFLSWLLLIVDWAAKTRNLISKEFRNFLFALSLTVVAAMASSWTWFPAFGHMSHHYHMNGIMYIIPFGLSVYILVGVLIQMMIRWMVLPKSDQPSNLENSPKP